MAQIYQNVYSSATYTLTVVHDLNGGDTGPGNVTASTSSSAASVSVYADISQTVPTRSGYRFLGYSTVRDGDVSKQPGGTVSRSFTRQATYDHTETVEEQDGNTYVTKYYTTSSQSVTVYLYAVWEAAASTVSASDGTLGTAQTITISAISPEYTHNLRYAFGGTTGTIASGVSTSYSWTPALTLAELIPAANSASCTIYCDTVSNGTVIGTAQTVITLSVPATVKCTVASVAIAETVAGIDSKFHAFVQNKSKVSVTGTFNSGNGSPAYGATVSATTITVNGQTLSGNGSVTNILTTSGTNSYTLTITDTRGRTDSYTSTFNVLAYLAPSVTETANRNSADDTQIDISYSWDVSSCSNLNDKAIVIKYKPSGGSQTTVNVSPATYTGTGTYTITGSDPNDTYAITVTVTDYFTSANASSSVAATGNRIMHVSATDRTVSWHGTNSSDGYDHQHNDQVFHGFVDVVPRRCVATLSSAGWHRIMVITGRGSGSFSFTIDITIGRNSSNTNNETHVVKLVADKNLYEFMGEITKINTLGITKIRYTTDGSGNGYIDIYYSLSASNTVYVNFLVNCRPTHWSAFVAQSMTSVADAPTGETVETEYTFGTSTGAFFNALNAVTANIGTLNGISIDVSTIASGSSGTYSCPGGSKHLFLCIGASTNNRCFVLVNTTTTGAVTTTKTPTGSNITLTTATNSLTIASASYEVRVLHVQY